jgi:hypothetical protein
MDAKVWSFGAVLGCLMNPNEIYWLVTVTLASGRICHFYQSKHVLKPFCHPNASRIGQSVSDQRTDRVHFTVLAARRPIGSINHFLI